ncbi:MAG: cardiolipin synthase [Mogibacterium sp.]|nr:cardiolipin synthase [Mogibacterium sp.]
MTGILEQFLQFFTLSHIMVIIYVLNALIALGLIFFDDSKSPSATMAWIMVLFMVPAAGLLLYLIFSQNIARQQIFKMTEDEKEGKKTLLGWQKEAVQQSIPVDDDDVTSRWKEMIRMNIEYADSLLTANDSVEIITDGKEMFERLCSDIENAKYTIKLCYYIVKDDFVGKRLIELLTKKASEGVKVRLLMDALGSRSIGYSELRAFKKAGGTYAFFFKPLIRHLYLRINYRNHRKLAIIDNEIGYIGGFNIAKEYLGYKKKFGYWRDTQLIIRGNALTTLNERFYMDWRYASKENIDLIDQSVRYALRTETGDIPIQIVSCGPESEKEEIKMAFMKMITNARKNIYIQTPYLVPDEPMMESLRMAARSGIDVRIMIPCMPDHPFVYRTTLYNAGRLINDGARIYIYENGFMHAKTLSIDGEVCTVGSANFDNRSFRLNFESNAFIYDRDVTEELDERFMTDINLSRPYTQDDRDRISNAERAAESISRLLTEIL